MFLDLEFLKEPTESAPLFFANSRHVHVLDTENGAIVDHHNKSLHFILVHIRNELDPAYNSICIKV